MPVVGKAFRFAPGCGMRPAARFWKIWTQGNEIYASGRTLGGVAKVSVHQSGQIHYRLGPKHKQDFAPIMSLAGSTWQHAFEIRFLLSEGAGAPTNEKDSLKNKSAYLIPVPSGKFLIANLIVGPPGTLSNAALPPQFIGADRLWEAKLADGRVAVLVARMPDLDDENRKKIAYYREELKVNATFSETPKDPYVEIHHLHWSDGGNVILVVPMGDEAIRSEPEKVRSLGAVELRSFHYYSPHALTEITAPDGSRVAVIELDAIDQDIELAKNEQVTRELGLLRMRMEPSRLIRGSEFTAQPSRLVSVPSLAGVNARDWAYLIYPRFDGFALSADVRLISTSFRNKNFDKPLNHLRDEEEILVRIPSENLTLVATMDAPETSAMVSGHFQLRDHR